MVLRIVPALIFSLLVVHAQASNCVQVKDRGPVSPDHLSCSDGTEGDAVERICYDEKNAYLIVKQQGSYSEYCGVQTMFASELLKNQLKSEYMKTHIRRDIFDCSIFLPPSYAGKCR